MYIITVDIKWAIVTVQNGLFHLSFHNSVRKCIIFITYEEMVVCNVEGTCSWPHGREKCDHG